MNVDVGGIYYQISSESTYTNVKKARIIDSTGDANWINVISIDDSQTTRIVFRSDCALWNSGASDLTRTRLHITSLSSLQREGVYCYDMKVWKRIYMTKDGICIQLIEDVPESGGQFCLWSAGIVMAKYFEFCEPLRYALKGKKLLELGAGSGLTSMVASILGAKVFSTEQESCLPYLRKNASLNPDITINIKTLGWTEACMNTDLKFDFVFGCDITYEPKNFSSIINLIQTFLKPSAVAYICHDDDSCPLSKFASDELKALCQQVGLTFTKVNYEECLDSSFYSEKIFIWQLSKDDTNL